MLLQLLDARFGRPRPLRPFEGERAGDDADGQCPGLACGAGDGGRRARARAAAHARGHEDHIGAGQRVAQLLQRLFGRPRARLWVAAGAEAARRPLADGDAHRGHAAQQRLLVGVDGHKLDPDDVLIDHAVHGIAATAAHANHANQRRAFGGRHPLCIPASVIHVHVSITPLTETNNKL